MACSTYNPCQEPTCNSCNPVNPCYDNCGCNFPSTFDCVDTTKDYDLLNVDKGTTGTIVLNAIEAKFLALINEQYKVKTEDADLAPDYLIDKIDAGTNISIDPVVVSGVRKLRITGGEGIGPAGADTKVYAGPDDDTSASLYEKTVNGTYVKRTLQSPTSNAKLKFDITPSDLISTDTDNALNLDAFGKLKVLPPPTIYPISIVAGPGINAPFVGNTYTISTNGTVTPLRTYFDGIWKDFVNPLGIGTSNGAGTATLGANSVKYRLLYNGTIEFKGNAIYTINFVSGNKVVLSNVASIPTGGSNLASIEIDRTVDMKSIMTFTGATTLGSTPSLLGYTIRMTPTGKLQLEFLHDQAAAKQFVLSFDGCVFHPNI
jgi:hypothetical protein